MLLQRVKQNRTIFGEQFPTVGEGTTYHLEANDNWLTGFWTGLLWLTVGTTQDQAVAEYAQARLASFEKRLDDGVRITHDLGFLYTLSARAMANDERRRSVPIGVARRKYARRTLS